jgi:hypothetical protein
MPGCYGLHQDTGNQIALSHASIVLRHQAEDSAKTAVVATKDILYQALLVMSHGLPKNTACTYGDHRTQCSSLGQELHYWGLAIDQIIFVEKSKIPWGGIRACGRCRRSAIWIRLCLSWVRRVCGLRIAFSASGLLVGRIGVRWLSPGCCGSRCSLVCRM